MVWLMQKHLPLPYITSAGFSSLFVNVGGTGATLALVFFDAKITE